jgi:hypothetical protein
LSVNSNRLFQFFKYSVYALLAFNVYVFWSDEVHAATVQYSGGIPWLEVIGAYAATIDTAAWVVLLLMFELETYVLEDHHYDRIVTLLAGVIDLCSLAGNDWSYAVGLDEYLQVTAANCSSLSDASSFQRFAGIPAVTDAAGLNDIRNLAWVDVINAAVWLLIVLILEIDVWLQERNKLDGALLQASNAFKVVLYSSLFIAAIYWGVKGDFIDFWDALLWLIAFVFIELNVFEWRQEAKEATLQEATSPSS